MDDSPSETQVSRSNENTTIAFWELYHAALEFTMCRNNLTGKSISIQSNGNGVFNLNFKVEIGGWQKINYMDY